MLMFALVLVLILLALRPDPAGADPVFPPDLDDSDVERLRRNLEPVISLSERELLRRIPHRAGIYFVDCPNCDGGAQEGQIDWTFEDPDRVFCKYCGLKYPNERFPDTGILSVVNPVGETQEYPYWEDDSGYRHFFQAKGWYRARAWFANAAHDLATLYFATGDRSLARRAALILNRFAEVYPGYCVHHDLPFRQKIIFPGSQGFPYPVQDYRASKWDWWAYMDIPENLIYAYDLIRDSGELDETMIRRIEDEFLHASVAFVRGFPPALGNMDPTLLRGMVAAGRVLKEPDYIHDVVDRISRLIAVNFLVDGVWREGAISYHNQTIGGLRQVMERLDGYSDPDGYVHPDDGERYDNLDLNARFPILTKAAGIPELLCYPNGRVVPTHDTWAKGRRDAPESTGPMLLPGMGHARLSTGSGDDRTQTYLHFSGGYGHQHADLLSITLYARGQERLSDIGYTHTRHRCWTISTLSHNTVAVDGKDQAFGSENAPSDGNLLLFVPNSDTFQAIEASGDRAYPGVTSTYRRMLLQIGLSSEQTYVVDLFRVAGGRRHEYILAGDADHDGAVETDLPAEPHAETLLPAGVTATLPTGESVKGDAGGHNLGYAFIRDVRRAEVSRPWRATFTSQASPEGSVRVYSLTGPGGDLFTARAPSIRNADEDDTLLDAITMPMLLHRREGENLSTLFSTVLEPRGDRPAVTGVDRLDAQGGTDDDIVLRVEAGGITDYILSASDENRTLECGDLRFRGRVGFVRERNGEVEELILIGGTLLQKGIRKLGGRGTRTGSVLKALRKADGDDVDGLVIDTDLPTGVDLAGLTAIVKDGDGFTYGHKIKTLQHPEAGGALLELEDDPGYEITAKGGRLLFFPGRSWTGPATIEIPTVTSLRINASDVSATRTGDWINLVRNAPFTPRDTSEDVVFQDKLWISNAYYHSGILTRDLWNSSDGISWHLVSEATPYDGYSEMVAYKDKMWAVKGSVWSSPDGVDWTRVLEETPFGPRGYGELVIYRDRMWQLGSGTDVWRTGDGVDWIRVASNAPYGDRSASAVAAYDNRLWVMGGRIDGRNDPPEKGYPHYTTLNDVWCSEDGVHWTRVLEHAPWSPRMWFIPKVYAGRLWIIGGYDNANSVNLGDVWYTEDGREWHEFKPDTRFSPRHESTCYVFKNSLWVVAGNTWPVVNDVWRLTLP